MNALLIAQAVKNAVNTLARAPVHAYRYAISPLLPPSCRFYPSCSAYALEAMTRHGAARGLMLAVGRVCRCHPWHPGGIDLVPDTIQHRWARRSRLAGARGAAQTVEGD